MSAEAGALQSRIDVWDEGWWYVGLDTAVAAMEGWDGQSRDLPDGWFRHQPSGRRREDRDPAREHVQP